MVGPLGFSGDVASGCPNGFTCVYNPIHLCKEDDLASSKIFRPSEFGMLPQPSPLSLPQCPVGAAPPSTPGIGKASIPDLEGTEG